MLTYDLRSGGQPKYYRLYTPTNRLFKNRQRLFRIFLCKRISEIFLSVKPKPGKLCSVA